MSGESLSPAEQAPFEEKPPERPLPLCRRRDLVIARTGTPEAPRWTVKDPVSLRYYELRGAELFVLNQLDGQTSVTEIQERFFRQYSPQRLSADQIVRFAWHLWNQGLAVMSRYGMSAALLERQSHFRRRQRSARWKGVLAMRFRGIDPDAALERLVPVVGWLFSKTTLVIGVVLIAAALVLVQLEWERLTRELPRFDNFLRADRFFWLVSAIAVVKVLHELGHAIVCKKEGGECRELGFMLLAFIPCLYCNVSDSWLMAERRRRIAVAGAGIFVELVLAACCTFLWYFSYPGVFHSLCLYVMVVCSVNTVLLNGNPLLRYDGYYIFSDLVNTPNLMSRAQQTARALFSRWVLGVQAALPREARGLHTVWLAFYGMATGIYRWMVIFGILYMLYRVADARGVGPAVVLFGAALVLGRAVDQLSAVSKYVFSLRRNGELRMKRTLLVLGSCIALAAIALLWPFPREIEVPGLIRGADLQPIYVTSPGRFDPPQELVAGQAVEKGAVLAVLVNHEIEQDILKLEGQVERQTIKLQLLRTRQFTDPGASAQIPTAVAALDDYTARLQARRDDLRRLTLRAPATGRMLPADDLPSEQHASVQLRREGHLFEGRNIGTWLDVGTPFAVIAASGKNDAVLYVDQAEVSSIPVGGAVRLVTPQTGGSPLQGTVVEVAAQPVSTAPIMLAMIGEIPIQADASGNLKPARPRHEVRVRIANPPEQLLIDQPTWGAVAVGSESLGQRFLHWLRRTLTFEI